MAILKNLLFYFNDCKDRNIKEDMQFYCVIDEDNKENTCMLWSEDDIIEHANNLSGYNDGEDIDEITDVDTAINYLADMDSGRLYFEIENI